MSLHMRGKPLLPALPCTCFKCPPAAAGGLPRCPALASSRKLPAALPCLLAVIAHFISDYERHGAYTGFPSLGVEWQKMERPVLRQALGMKASGWLVCWYSAAHGVDGPGIAC